MTREVLTSDRFFEIAKRTAIDVPFPEAGNGAVIPIVGLSPTERTAFERDFQAGAVDLESNRLAFREKLVARCARGEDLVRIFSDDDVARLGDSNAGLVERLFDEANKASGFSNQDIDETIKNSDATQGDV